jgi:hypothetical protein
MALIVSVAFTSAAQACINDREVGNAEREFKSNYNYKPGERPLSSPEMSEPATASHLMVYGGMAMGTLLLVGAGALCLGSFKRS